jgi:RimJ/RimL family protein N-acetyltransferase
MIPTLDTPRLTLRAHTLADFDDYCAMWGDPEVTRYIGGKTFTREECWTRFLRQSGHWALMGFGYWVVREKASNRFVGEVGFLDLKREMQPSLEGFPEAGWVLASWSHGRGFATEAVNAMHAWIDAARAPKRVVCMIDVGNSASIRVAEKCGYTEFTRTTFRSQPVILFDRLGEP